MEIRRFVARFPHILPYEMKNLSSKEKWPLVFRSLRGYIIYYAVISENISRGGEKIPENSEIVSYCFLKKNYLQRYRFMKHQDYIINPYYTFPKSRGKGIAQEVLKNVLQECKGKVIWALVAASNIPSLHILEKIGFEKVGYSHNKNWQHQLINEKTNLVVLRYQDNEI